MGYPNRRICVSLRKSNKTPCQLCRIVALRKHAGRSPYMSSVPLIMRWSVAYSFTALKRTLTTTALSVSERRQLSRLHLSSASMSPGIKRISDYSRGGLRSFFEPILRVQGCAVVACIQDSRAKAHCRTTHGGFGKFVVRPTSFKLQRLE